MKQNNAVMAEYIWIDGQRPTGKLRSKTKLLSGNVASLKEIPYWRFDGSSTEQAEGHFSDLILMPVNYFPDPIRGGNNILVLCEVLNADGTAHKSNARAVLKQLYKKYENAKPIVGIEQEYTLYGANDWPLGWPGDRGFPHPQGRYYCGVGYDEVHGRPLVEAHMDACLHAGISISGVNAEVMPAQWEFQVGPLDPLTASDQLWTARWLLYRLGENYSAYAKLDPKPMSGDWNGAGAHTNFSTAEMREKKELKIIEEACKKLEQRHAQHMKVYGADNDKRLTGKHETCSIDQFKWGAGDRGASVRVPLPIDATSKHFEYLEDRRPGANMDPYKVCSAIIETICGDGFDPKKYDWVEAEYRFI